MKYLNSYKLFEATEEDMKRIYTPLINWDLINDMREMSLEYIDEGVTLHIAVENRWAVIVNLYFDHDDDRTIWLNNYVDAERLPLQAAFNDVQFGPSVRYKIEFLDFTPSFITSNIVRERYEKELLETMKLAYPEERISIKTHFGQ